jgi:octopine/nopaline transport system substrate-binding protein
MPKPAIPTALVILLAALAGPFAAADSARAAEPLRIGTYAHYPPWTILGPDGRISGFEPDLVTELCRRLEASCTLRAVDWEHIFDDLEAGRYDAYIGGMTITAEREQRAAFSRPYATNTGSFATLAGSPLTAVLSLNRLDIDRSDAETRDGLAELFEALRGRRLGVHVATVHEQFADSHLGAIAEIRRYTEEQRQYDDLAQGRLDAVLASSASLYYFVATHRDQAQPPVLFGPLLKGRIFGRGLGAAMSRGNAALRRRLDAAITATIADGTLPGLSFKWFGYNVTGE